MSTGHFWQSTTDDTVHCRNCAEQFNEHTMQTQCPRPKLRAVDDFFRPDGMLLVSLIARLFTRNNPNPMHRAADTMQMVKNLANFTSNPEMHLAYCMALMERYAVKGQVPTFEIGMVFGAAMAMCACSRAGEKLLKKILDDVTTQQNSNGESNAEVRPGEV